MNKTTIIIRREFLTRVRKKSFIVMTLLGPVLFAAMMMAPVWFAGMEKEDVKKIAVLDSTQLFIQKIPETEKYKFTYVSDVKLEDFKKNMTQTDFFGILYIPPYISYTPSGTEFFSYKQPPGSLIMHIANAIEKEIETEKLKAHQIENLDEILKSVKTRIDIRTFRISEGGGEKENYHTLSMAVGYAAAFMVYLFVFMFGAQVQRGVIEEKTSRIVEVIISSVRPFQLMMGKVLGVALVGLTQFVAWVALTLILVATMQAFLLPDLTDAALQQSASTPAIGSLAGSQPVDAAITGKAAAIFDMLQSINFGLLLGCFLFFFIGGYLLYGSLFAAIGAAVDAETDSQQFMLPLTAPLIIGIMVMMTATQNPDGALAFWFSIIPFTSPVVMMARIPFGVPFWELLLSMALLAAAFIGAIWLSAKIYRTGILIYGKKITYAELWKWLTYKN